MATAERRLIVNADDFGDSDSINQAVVQAHQTGILTTASLMVAGGAFEQAVQLARENPSLGVGLHITLAFGRPVLPPSEVPALVDGAGRFSNNPAGAGFRYFFSPARREQIAREVAAQFERFHATGLKLDHVNGHLHFHLHPAVFAILMRNAERWGVRHMRLTHDPIRMSHMVGGGGRHFYRWSHALAFGALSRWARPHLRRKGIRHTNHVFGLMENARVDSAYARRLLPKLPPGDSELYAHPSMHDFLHEYQALACPEIREETKRLNIKLARYQDL